jgi:hypothetical protein
MAVCGKQTAQMANCNEDLSPVARRPSPVDRFAVVPSDMLERLKY